MGQGSTIFSLMVKVKVCGIKEFEDARVAVDADTVLVAKIAAIR